MYPKNGTLVEQAQNGEFTGWFNNEILWRKLESFEKVHSALRWLVLTLGNIGVPYSKGISCSLGWQCSLNIFCFLSRSILHPLLCSMLKEAVLYSWYHQTPLPSLFCWLDLANMR
jgi:hypothetical protein